MVVALAAKTKKPADINVESVVKDLEEGGCSIDALGVTTISGCGSAYECMRAMAETQGEYVKGDYNGAHMAMSGNTLIVVFMQGKADDMADLKCRPLSENDEGSDAGASAGSDTAGVALNNDKLVCLMNEKRKGHELGVDKRLGTIALKDLKHSIITMFRAFSKWGGIEDAKAYKRLRAMGCKSEKDAIDLWAKPHPEIFSEKFNLIGIGAEPERDHLEVLLVSSATVKGKPPVCGGGGDEEKPAEDKPAEE